MTYEDFFKALTPYNYQKPKSNQKYFQQFKQQVSDIMEIADVDGDGQISFSEFYFFVLLCQTPEKYVAKEFKKHGGKMGIGKLAKIVGNCKEKTNLNTKRALKGIELDEYLDVNIGMCERIIHGKKEITLEEYVDFRNKLIESLWHYEFHQFDIDCHDHISAFDMAQSMYVYYIPFHKIPDYMLHLDKFKDNKRGGCCSVEQYCAFQYFMRHKQKIVQEVLDKGKIDFDGLREICNEFEAESEYCKKKGVKITDEMLMAFLNAMDLDGNGILDAEETVGILGTRKEICSRKL